MTVRELFSVVIVGSRKVTIIDRESDIVWQKEISRPPGKNPFLDREIAWIYRIDSSEICLRIEEEQDDQGATPCPPCAE